MERRLLMHEVWVDFGENGESLPGVCVAGPLGDDFRGLLGPWATLLTPWEPGSHFEAMTIYYRLMDWGVYTTNQSWDFEIYPEEWFAEQYRA